jgi:hypothetical protein
MARCGDFNIQLPKVAPILSSYFFDLLSLLPFSLANALLPSTSTAFLIILHNYKKKVIQKIIKAND